MAHKVALITGANEGLGRTCAGHLAQRGYDTISVARSEQRLKELAAHLSGTSSGQHSYLVADLSTEEGLGKCLSALAGDHINVLVNNAGFSQFGLFREAQRQTETNILRVNVEAVLQLNHGFLQQATQHGWRIQYMIDNHIRPATEAMERLVKDTRGLDRKAFIHWYCIMISATSTIFSFGAECQDLFGVDPCEDSMVEGHADMLVSMLLAPAN